MVVLRLAAAAAILATAGAAQAHVAVQPASATAGSYQVLRFGVGHGCDGEATTAVRIEMPPGLGSARPQPKPGWKLTIDHAVDKPDTVTAITWSGRLPADQFDELLIQVKLPGDAGRLYFPTIQTCGRVAVRWTEVPVSGGARPEHPAPAVTLSPATPAPEAGHDHHH
jgi:uncharacterized protein YcnI